MAGGDELSGFLEVKVPTRVRKRGFTPWKAWKRQWCTVRRNSEEGVEVQLGNNVANCVQVSLNSTLCRTESRSRQFAFGVFPDPGKMRHPLLFLAGSSEKESQEWMARIRALLHPARSIHNDDDCNVSLVDNAHSRAAGLTGLYGRMDVGAHQVTILDPNTAQVKAGWTWPELHQFHLAATETTEDENNICVIHTSSEFCAGPGQLLLFCLQAPQLLQSLLTRGRLQRLLASPLPSPPMPLRSGRRLSRSESDLRFSWSDTSSNMSSSSPRCFLRQPVLLRSHSGSRDSGVRVSTASDDSGHLIKGKVATSLLSAGLGLMFSTPGCSEADSESLHEYQQVGLYDSDDDLELTSQLYRNDPNNQSLTSRRESGVSLASGIYEEIADTVLPSGEEANHYENPASLRWGSFSGDKVSPPPLPPRKHRHFHTMESVCDEGLGEGDGSYYGTSSAVSLPSPLMRRFKRERCFSDSCSPVGPSWCPDPIKHPALTRLEWGPKPGAAQQPEPDYMPMSPGGRSLANLEEQPYMVMASLNTT